MMNGRMMMMSLLLSVVVSVLMMSNALVAAINNDNNNNDDHNNDDTSTCGLYLAISSTSTIETTNWGLFIGSTTTNEMTTVNYHSPIGNPEIGIIVSNLRIYNEGLLSSYSNTDLTKLVDYFESFFWVPSTAGAKFFLNNSMSSNNNSGERAFAAISGAGVLASYSKKMTNADWDHRAAYVQTSEHNNVISQQQQLLSHPNRGAISSYNHCQIRSIVANIKMGSEVFMEYGDSWEDKQSDEEEEELTKDDYGKIDETVTQMIAFFTKYNHTALDDDSRLEIYSFLMKDIMKAAVGPAKARRIAAILPPNPNDLPLVPLAGGTLAYSDPTAHRSLSFLQKYGLCMDHIYPASSTIPNIGRGAFAKRTIRSGNLVVPIPLTHISDKSIFNMYPLTTDIETGRLIRASDTVITQQLIVNYCFGHPASTMLFFPSGSMTTLINHSKEQPNAKLQWSTHPNHQKLWYDLDPHTTLMEEEYMYMGLILEVVALRDIEPHEEIFIDYGTEWQTAYDKHVQIWNQKIQSGIIPKVWPIRAIDLNTQYHTVSALKPFPTIDETDFESFPSNVMLMAFLLLKDTENAGTMEDPKLWNMDEPNAAYVTENLFEVRVVRRQPLEYVTKDGSSTTTTSYSYTVQWVSSSSTDDEDGNNEPKMVVVKDVPHEAMVFVDRPGMTDQHYLYEHSFRHYIGIPDEIFPSGPWRNVAVVE